MIKFGSMPFSKMIFTSFEARIQPTVLTPRASLSLRAVDYPAVIAVQSHVSGHDC